MKIAASTIQNSAVSDYFRSEQTTQSTRFETTRTNTPKMALSIQNVQDTSTLEDEEILDPKLRAIVAVLEQLIGKKIKITKFRSHGTASFQAHNSEKGDNGLHVGWAYSSSTTYSLKESQSLEFNSSGQVLTQDGKKITFSLNLKFARSFSMTQSSSFRAGDALSDPLVISMDGNAPIGEGKFDFDLIKGGESENISNLSKGSAFLALDNNDNGKIDDGTELFGPQSGDGFSELAIYDEDKNGWIDENDSIFSSLILWYKSADEDNIETLKEAGIGAISLQAADGSFDFKDENNNTLAQIQKTSVALSESGEAKALFGLNIAV